MWSIRNTTGPAGVPPNTEPEIAPEVRTSEKFAQATRRRRKYLFLVFLGLILIGAINASVYSYVKSKKTLKAPDASSVSDDFKKSVSQHQDVSDIPDTQTYENTFLGVKLTHPKNWNTTESENKDSVRLESPTFKYETISKGQISGNFRIYIRKTARDIDAKYIGKGYAIQSSEKLTYSQPVAGQRADTNISLFGLDKPDNFRFS